MMKSEFYMSGENLSKHLKRKLLMDFLDKLTQKEIVDIELAEFEKVVDNYLNSKK